MAVAAGLLGLLVATGMPLPVAAASDAHVVQQKHPDHYFTTAVASIDGKMVFVAGSRGNVLVLDISGAAPVVVKNLALGTYPAKAVASPDGRYVYVAYAIGQSKIVRIDTADFSYVEHPIPGGASDLAWSEDGSRLLAITGGHSVTALHPITFQELGRSRGLLGTASGLTLSADGSELYVKSSWERAIIALDAATLVENARFPFVAMLPGDSEDPESVPVIENLVGSTVPDRAFLSTGISSPRLFIINLRTGTLLSGPLPLHSGVTTGTALDGGRDLLLHIDGTYSIVDAGGQISGPYGVSHHSNWWRALAFSAASGRMIVAGGTELRMHAADSAIVSNGHAYAGHPVTLSAAVTGSPTGLSWEKSVDGIIWSSIPGATGPALTIAEAEHGDAGRYRLVGSPTGSSVLFADFMTMPGTLTVADPVSAGLAPAAQAVFTIGAAGTYAVQVTADPAVDAWTVVGGLPAGLAFDAGTAVLSGTPEAGTQGVHTVTLKATQSVISHTAVLELDLTVLPNSMNLVHDGAPAGPVSTKRGTTLEYSGSGLIAGETVSAALDGLPAGSATVDAAGEFDLSVTVPTSARIGGQALVFEASQPTGGVLAETVQVHAFDVPEPPQHVTVVPGNGTATLSWSPPAGVNGSDLSGYAVSDGGPFVEVGLIGSHTFTGLANGVSHHFVVTAVNAAGRSAPGSARATPFAETTTTVEVSGPGTVVLGEKVFATARVTPQAAGSFTIRVGADTYSVTAAHGEATIAFDANTAGSLQVTAQFNPATAAFSGSTSAPTALQVNQKRLAGAPPAPDTGALLDLIGSAGLDVPGATGSFRPGTGIVLSDLDAAKPFSGTLAWPDSADSFVDVFSYSTPKALGTFQVVGGRIQLAGVNLSHLDPGRHHLVFVGQTSGTTLAVQVTVADRTLVALPVTGADSSPWLFGGVFAVAVGMVLVRASRRGPSVG